MSCTVMQTFRISSQFKKVQGCKEKASALQKEQGVHLQFDDHREKSEGDQKKCFVNG